MFVSIHFAASEILFPNIWLSRVIAILCDIHTFEKYLSQLNLIFLGSGYLFKLIKSFWNHYSSVQLFGFPFYFLISTHLTSMTLMNSSKLFMTELNKAVENKATNHVAASRISFNWYGLANQYTLSMDVQSAANPFNYTIT